MDDFLSETRLKPEVVVVFIIENFTSTFYDHAHVFYKNNPYKKRKAVGQNILNVVRKFFMKEREKPYIYIYIYIYIYK